MNKLLLYTEVPTPFGFENWLTFWLILVISVLNAVLMLFVGYKFLQVLQLSGYKTKDYWAWMKSNKYKDWAKLVMLSFLSSAALLVTNVLLEQIIVYKIMTYAGLLFYFLFCFIYILNVYNAPQKTPLKYTHRMTRLCVVLSILVFIVTFAIMTASELYIPYFEFGAVGLIPLFLPLVIQLAHWVISPFEMLNSNRYVCLAKKELAKHKEIKVVGITGSFGKTSVKNILTVFLSEKYKVCATPHSYNTPLGLSKTILGQLKEDDEILICEMGAKHIGDIKYLTDMVKPQIAVVTGIGNQHLLTFGSVENLKNTKFELVNGLNQNGKVYFNLDSEPNYELYDRAKCEKVGSTIESENGEVFISDIKVGERGSNFNLHFGEEFVECSTSLLGRHNISNILLCACVAKDFGISLYELQSAIAKLVPSAHRLALVPSGNSLIVIDDAYNGCVEGAKAALETIKQFKTKKIVITPGLVELGKEEFNCNFEFGKQMAEVCDYVIINGVVNYEALSSGLEFGGFDTSKILRAGSIKQAIEVMQKIASAGDVVLFENDLPDNYT